jgi:hypothetical protein
MNHTATNHTATNHTATNHTAMKDMMKRTAAAVDGGGEGGGDCGMVRGERDSNWSSSSLFGDNSCDGDKATGQGAGNELEMGNEGGHRYRRDGLCSGVLEGAMLVRCSVILHCQCTTYSFILIFALSLE